MEYDLSSIQFCCHTIPFQEEKFTKFESFYYLQLILFITNNYQVLY